MRYDYIEQGDCLELMKQIPDGSIDLVVTDPPYRTTARGSCGGTGGILKDELNMRGKVFTHNDVDISEWIPELYRVLKEGSHCYIMTNNVNLYKYLLEIQKTKFKIFKVLIWKKNNCITNPYYMDNHEYIIFCRKGRAKKINNCGTKSVLEVANPRGKCHPTEKPIELMSILIRNSSAESDVILDPFLGVGTTAIAAIRAGRHYIGFELDPTYFEIARDRLDEAEGKVGTIHG